MWWPKQYSDLNPFENLEIIHGTTKFEGYSMIITRLSIHSLGLSSLKEIRNGNVLIKANKNLCYVDSINWRTILKTNQQKEIENNQSNEECAAADKMCDPLCSVGGCWGPGPFQCFSCHTFSLDGECLQPCSILERVQTNVSDVLTTKMVHTVSNHVQRDSRE
ncbi:epidermal growth factor receptor-like [Spea bombifrons]|uniref:epidermal growth factor receptor-like n=1 Tax=Spea bombifrons TaxID=233779 RepID=UPI002349DDB7|nr:epidermal growth factor receptor-like [Spea bombifrons]